MDLVRTWLSIHDVVKVAVKSLSIRHWCAFLTSKGSDGTYFMIYHVSATSTGAYARAWVCHSYGGGDN